MTVVYTNWRDSEALAHIKDHLESMHDKLDFKPIELKSQSSIFSKWVVPSAVSATIKILKIRDKTKYDLRPPKDLIWQNYKIQYIHAGRYFWNRGHVLSDKTGYFVSRCDYDFGAR
jgi:hypothetical protein